MSKRIERIIEPIRTVEIVGVRLLTEREASAMWNFIPKVNKRWWMSGRKAASDSYIERESRKVNAFRPALIIRNTNEYGGANPGDKFEYNGYKFTVINAITALCDQCIGGSYNWNSMENRFPIYFEEETA